MINLLPEKEKEQLLREKNIKLVLVLGNIVVISLVYLILVLFALKFYILESLVSQDAVSNSADQQSINPELVSLKEEIKTDNGYLIKANNFYNKQIYFSDILRFISTMERPAGLSLIDMTIQTTKEAGRVKVTLDGLSDTRENLQTFKNTLEGEKALPSGAKIQNVYFPPDIWIKAKNINFYITFEVLNQ